MINKFLGMGYLSSDPKLNEYDSGKKKITFSIGITLNKETLWIEIEAWDRIAENCNKILTKGSLVFVEGKLKFNSWKDKSGNHQSKTYCTADFVKIINVKNDKNIVKVDQIEDISKNIEMKSDIKNQNDESLEDIPW
jgi:single-strand DNA-binding protein|tara:strand:+ start:254 stop:664 length:411 start_codon:yes stop_codon:yes gene_type:complete